MNMTDVLSNDLGGYVGQVLDQKYRIHRLLGRGGMGAVFLAVHLGTDRYVAVKLITPQYMRDVEFVERFKREARAAGRLRHPNIVDVTDFGFASVGNERIAYLVMEYLDGCSLRDVLAEEKRLPLNWVVEILGQVCSAVHEAHRQGIVHRDLKPDNIWLEPNGLGSYRAKVLDFGIAKLAAPAGSSTVATVPQPARVSESADARKSPASIPGRSAVVPAAQFFTAADAETFIESSAGPSPAADSRISLKPVGESLLLQEPSVLLPPSAVHQDAVEFTRIGALLGTPQFMSPEQCRGEALDARSDTYSLGVIAYLMLAGTPPFSGDTNQVIRAHQEETPVSLNRHLPKLPKGVSQQIMLALEKDPAARPSSAMAFGHSLRANADDLGALYRRAFALYSEYFPQIVKLSVLAHIPVLVVMLIAGVWRMIGPGSGVLGFFGTDLPVGILEAAASFVTASIISGMTAIIVTQLAVAPLKPVELATAFRVLQGRWRPFLKTGFMVTLRIWIGLACFAVPGVMAILRYSLWAPVVLMEGLEAKSAMLRSRVLASRSRRAIVIAVLFQFAVPAIGKSIAGLNASGTDGVKLKLATQLVSLTSVLFLPLVSIVPALLYLKMRQLGGESSSDVMAQIGYGYTTSRWEERMRSRIGTTRSNSLPGSAP
jgi:serine/threonine protein kinase